MSWQPLGLGPNSHSFKDITHFLGMTAHPVYVQYHISYKKHHTHILWDHTTLWMTAHALYSWHHSLYIWHYIHSICVIKTSASIIPHQLYVWHHSQYAWHHMNTLWRHTPLGMTSKRVYLWHPKNIYDINVTAFMASDSLHITSPPGFMTCRPL